MQVIVDDASSRYGRREIFAAFSATFPANRVTALVGPSGSGKSTLLAAIAGFKRLSSGRVWHDYGGALHPPRPSRVSWVAQDPNLLRRRTVLDNVMIGPLSEGEIMTSAVELAFSAIEEVGLLDRFDSPARALSGGERQRVAVARALASSRPLILADEPSASLDETNTRGLARLLHSISGRSTIIVATHDPVMIDAADTAVHLRGRSS